MPTLADLCGISVPEGYDPDGLSLRPLLEGEADEWPRDHLIEQYIGGAYAKAFPPKPYEYTVVMTERWRLVNSDGEFLFDIEADPAQREDLSEKHPEVVAKLRALYDPFWEKIEPSLTAVRIDLGNPAENPTVLCSQDWYMSEGNPPWNFGSIKKLPKVTGPWMVEVKQSGTYRLTLRQMPVEADLPVKAVRAKVQIAGQEMESEVQAGSKGVVFEMELSAGETELLTWLYD